ncbi:hypothetical protein M441DRAFT_393715 [Trichoderma asperellum CBS 433.97]|uniref:Uncharacterized protein n=1 Tax=Trichoderma asperellum (strain ATCC 204424 / CBS 433.97 / NBRC 101777) TaxID=1042311 RepID=A0A2T3ZD01_TRIA4|nr:hypothetical protein M441DRAFT_393715 [Trichoderma asperellum CBS 433.97]PTB42687.1 hypothetical protein M441DRAFT_393715 [Trichoderma asperellum CBS 433.97]
MKHRISHYQSPKKRQIPFPIMEKKEKFIQSQMVFFFFFFFSPNCLPPPFSRKKLFFARLACNFRGSLLSCSSSCSSARPRILSKPVHLLLEAVESVVGD